MDNIFLIKLNDNELRNMSSLALAHIGDAVYELLVRSMLCENGKITSSSLHRKSVSHVSATAQARAASKIRSGLTEEEEGVFRRARNTRVNTIPKNADIGDYHAATALEAVFGWLYLRGDHDRIKQLFDIIMGVEHAS